MSLLQQRMEQTQSLRQEQQLTLHQMQSLEILQATLQELEQKIGEALVSNPTLELVDPGNEQLSGNPVEGEAAGQAAAETGEEHETEHRGGEGAVAEAPPPEPGVHPDATELFAEERAPKGVDDEWDAELSPAERLQEFLQDYPPESGTGHTQGSEDDEEKRRFRFDSLTASESLQDMLVDQLRQTDGLSEDERHIGEEIIGSIDEGGYLRSHPADIAISCSADIEQVKRILAVIQRFDPPGVGAQDLRECLLLQLERHGKKNTLAWQVVYRYLEDIGRNQIPRVAKALRVSPSALYDVMAEIRRLVPYPGSLRGHPEDNRGVTFIVPEVTVYKDACGEWQIEANRERRPQLRLSSHYLHMLKDPDTTAEVKSYIRQKIADSKLLLRALDSRESTIERITRSLLKFQRDFFENGIGSLRPLTLQEVAKEISLHETTVGRAIANKYLLTPHGLLPYKQFFSSGMATQGGDMISNVSIKQKILELVKGESSGAPLADQELVKLLSEQGLSVARRTVAKYREELGIMPSHMRRNFRV